MLPCTLRVCHFDCMRLNGKQMHARSLQCRRMNAATSGLLTEQCNVATTIHQVELEATWSGALEELLLLLTIAIQPQGAG